MESFTVSLVNFESQKETKDINDYIGEQLNKIITENESAKIYEFDIQLIEDSSVIMQLVDDHYLLINKQFMRKFYIHWRAKLLSPNININQFDISTLCVLLINPNVATAWSKRKSLLDSQLTTLTKEIEFNRLILTKHVKCESAYIHRRWLVKKLKAFQAFLTTEIDYFFQNLCFKVKANYYCWSYLNWILFYTIQESLLKENEIIAVFKYFFNKLEDYIYLNPSDNCIFHTRLNVVHSLSALNKLCYLFDEFTLFLSHELELFDDLLVRYPHLSTSWNYKRYLFLFLAKNKQFSLKSNDFDLKNLNEKIMEKLNLTEKSLNSSITNENWLRVLIDRELIIARLLASKCVNSENFIKFINKNIIVLL